jgi:glycosyltransferase involved in cell wall biosynthesis
VALTRVHRFELYDEAFSPPFQPWTSVYAALHATVVIAEHGRRYLLERGVPPSKLHLSRLGTPPMPRARPSDDGTWRVLSVSFLRPEKRVPLLAQALQALARARPAQRIAWTHLGDGPERAAVEAALAGCPPNLAVDLRGAVTPDGVRAHYASAAVDLFVQVSASEGLPVAVMEALAAGVPVLATDVGGVAEAVDAEVGALLPAAVDAAALAEAMAPLLAGGAAARRAAALDRWAERFDGRMTQAQHAHWLVAQARAAQGPAGQVS